MKRPNRKSDGGLTAELQAQLPTRAFWESFCEDLSIEGDTAAAPIQFPPGKLQNDNRKLLREGYIHMESPGLSAPLEVFCAVIDKLAEHNLPPVFLAVFDEFWDLREELRPMLATQLHAKYVQLPDFWCWRVEAGEAGWKPHRDKRPDCMYPDRRPKSLTVWIALTDVNPTNSCMYVVPAHLDRFYAQPGQMAFPGKLQDIRALPGDAGDVFYWTQHLFHWGGQSTDDHDQQPRKSIAFEFQRSDVPAFNNPLLNAVGRPDFEQRLALLAKQILQYRHMYNFHDDLVTVATDISDRYPLPSSVVSDA